jgi:arylsulfatase A-like enzyme
MRLAPYIRITLLCLVLAAAGCGDGGPGRGDVLLVIVDTARADHFSAYGYPRRTTPNLDRLAAEGQRYDDAWAQAPWTLPAIASILTGQPPHVHGAGRGEGGIHPVREEVATLAERMRSEGYATAAFINVLWCEARISALDRGFGVYDYHGSDETNRGHRDAGRTTDAVLAWLDRLGDEPFFAVVHYFDPHLTYDPPEPYDTIFDQGAESRQIPRGFGSASQVFQIRDGTIRLGPPERESLIARYDGEIRYTDEQFGRLREGLEQRGRWDDALVIVVADHGEEFWDHGGFEHGHSHYREMLRVPLIARRPGGPAGEVVDRRVRQLDIAPTVLDFAGIPLPRELPGGVLGTIDAPYAVAEGSLWAGHLISIRSVGGTLIRNHSTGAIAFYAPEDKLELHPLPIETETARELQDILEALPAVPTAPADPRQLTEEQKNQLRSLGYLQ